MKEQIFRKTSLDRVNSPEQLNDYICVANPSVWMILGAVILLLAGVCIWGVFGTIDTRVKAVVEIKDGRGTGYYSPESGHTVEAGMKVVIGDGSAFVGKTAPQPVKMDSGIDPYILYLGEYKEDDFCCEFTLSDGSVPDGIYSAEVIIESINPIRFVIK